MVDTPGGAVAEIELHVVDRLGGAGPVPAVGGVQMAAGDSVRLIVLMEHDVITIRVLPQPRILGTIVSCGHAQFPLHRQSMHL
jgi:hypothetical protein